MADDVVAELDAWIGAWEGPDDYRLTVQRARDEIVALRAQQEAVRGIAGNERRLSEAIAQQARDEALEEAAQACVGSGAIVAEARLCASAIRALKEKR